VTRNQQVSFAWKHRAHFAVVAAHNLEVTCRRHARQDWALPENQYRNPWAEMTTAPQSDFQF
jgi:hypothetical protein